MSGQAAVLEEATIKQQCRLLRMPTVASQCPPSGRGSGTRTADTSEFPRGTPPSAEIEERERNVIERRIREARLPRMKTLEEFELHNASRYQRYRFKNWPRVGTSSGPSPSSL